MNINGSSDSLKTLKNAILFQDFIKITEAIQHNSKTFLKIFLISDQIISVWDERITFKNVETLQLFEDS